MSVMGGPRDVSVPLPLNEAGGRRTVGERASLVEAAGCGEKYEGEAADDRERPGVSRAGVEGLEAACDGEGRRRSVGVSGAV
jgi:hypothetical protein